MNITKLIISKFILSFLLAVISNFAFAQYRHFLTPIGPSEGMTANTGIGRYGSVGAVIYNPAGLAGIKSKKVSASASAFSFNNIKITEKDVDGDTTSKYLETVPTQISTVFHEGKFTWAASLLVPYSMQADLRYFLKDDENTLKPTPIDTSIRMQETMLGLSVGYSLSSKYKLGLSIFGSKLDGHSRSTAIMDNSGTEILTNIKISSSAIVAYPILGFLSLENRNFAWGLRVSAPSFQLNGTQESKSQFLANNGNPSVVSESKRDLFYQKPLEIGGGISILTSPRFKFLFDVSVQAAMEYKRLKKDKFDEDDLTKTKTAGRSSLGFEYKLSNSDTITGGILYNQSPNVDTSGDFGDYQGGTLGYRKISNKVTTNVGIYYLYSTNDKDEEDQTIDVQTRFQTYTYGLFVSTTYRL